jgi:hypothetical protein
MARFGKLNDAKAILACCAAAGRRYAPAARIIIMGLLISVERDHAVMVFRVAPSSLLLSALKDASSFDDRPRAGGSRMCAVQDLTFIC